ncbi:hypothetical protein SCHPADRAFT_301683 [Schizopora paradoxa]|uniref:Uncharacterized protein n=1 Tax=Schizopora paradoxa TaxID=27342 RepID=A0A0H2RYT0_9AGAM|nr:hypothetical protein SCHPADRAFT_301683 [Schizopora paradoxa]
MQRWHSVLGDNGQCTCCRVRRSISIRNVTPPVFCNRMQCLICIDANSRLQTNFVLLRRICCAFSIPRTAKRILSCICHFRPIQQIAKEMMLKMVNTMTTMTRTISSSAGAKDVLKIAPILLLQFTLVRIGERQFQNLAEDDCPLIANCRG